LETLNQQMQFTEGMKKCLLAEAFLYKILKSLTASALNIETLYEFASLWTRLRGKHPRRDMEHRL
jgi:hypothetical protein